jgi:hypothetical protein
VTFQVSMAPMAWTDQTAPTAWMELQAPQVLPEQQDLADRLAWQGRMELPAQPDLRVPVARPEIKALQELPANQVLLGPMDSQAQQGRPDPLERLDPTVQRVRMAQEALMVSPGRMVWQVPLEPLALRELPPLSVQMVVAVSLFQASETPM